METWELIAREQIRDLVARYNACGDSGRFDELMELFWDDAEMEIGGPDGPDVRRGADAIRSIFTGTADRWKTELAPAAEPSAPHYVRHNVSTLVIDVDDPEHARGYCYFHTIMPHGVDHWGRYFDAYEARDGEWRFKRRRVRSEGNVGHLPG